MLSVWHSTSGFVLAMAVLNLAVAFFTPAMLSALASMDPQGAQWGNVASQLGYGLGPVVVAQIDAHSGMSGLIGHPWVAFWRAPLWRG